MLIKQTINKIIVSLALVLGVSMFSGNLALAADCGTKKNADGTTTVIETSILNCNSTNPPTGNATEDNGIWRLLIVIIQILTTGVGIAGVGGITYGAIRYATAGGNFATAKKALMIITNTAIGLAAYALMFAILNFIIPGGVLK